MMIPCSDDVRHITDESLAPFRGIEADYLGNSVSMILPVKPINSWFRGIGRRLLLEPTFESIHLTLSLEMEVSSTIISLFCVFIYLYFSILSTA
ncbi:unnamed protein product [Protopolystoma xenopodis]|uniref:Uncharacterized protein n=1 Tax=Protopolystoma xenopodis TaxID=117903 RepID=A0A448XNW6_9PLAT|nr:unnamed protein product [Protopolystoma xenopodis]